MSKVIRERLYDGETHFEVLCAVRADGSSPAVALVFPDEREVGELDVSARNWAVLDDLLDALAYGEELNMQRHNYLDDGVWELKVAEVRATFFDTDGLGGYRPKRGRDAWGVGQAKRRRIYDPDEMDEHIRLGYWFIKQGQKTTPNQLAEAFAVREEDLEYDRPEEDESSAIADS